MFDSIMTNKLTVIAAFIRRRKMKTFITIMVDRENEGFIFSTFTFAFSDEMTNLLLNRH